MSTLSPARLPYARALQAALFIEKELTPFCEKIAIAGSIRRKCETCGDIDLVCLPKTGGKAAIIERCQRAAKLLKNGEQYAVFQLQNGFQLDLWFAHNGGGELFNPEPSNWGVLLLARTGSEGHNIYLAERARALGLRFNPHRGVLRRGQVVASETEEAVFAALNLAYVRPEDRER